MAKSARASSRKRNNANLRAKVVNPIYDARTERLSAKLQELAAAPKPGQDKIMEVDSDEQKQTQNEALSEQSKDIDMDGVAKSSRRSSKQRNHTNRISKRAVKKKNKNSVVFASDIARRKRQAAQGKKR